MQKTKWVYFSVILLALALGLASFVALAKNDNAKNDKGNKSSQSEKNKTVNLKNYKKPNEAKGETHAQLHKIKTDEVIKNLEIVADSEEAVGNNQVSDEIDEVAAEEDSNQEGTTEAIEELESRNKFKTFLVGTDYKNLGQLRSSLVHNRNEIRKLTRTLNQLQAGESGELTQKQLEILMEERQRIKELILKNEDSFSLLGWVSRFLSGYEETPISEEEEGQITQEVEEALESTEEAENGGVVTEVPVPTSPTIPTTPTDPNVSTTSPITP